MTTFSKSKRISNFQPNYLIKNEDHNSDNNNVLTKSVDNHFIRCKNVTSNYKDANNHQSVTLSYLYTKQLYRLFNHQETILTPSECIRE